MERLPPEKKKIVTDKIMQQLAAYCKVAAPNPSPVSNTTVPELLAFLAASTEAPHSYAVLPSSSFNVTTATVLRR